MVVDNSDHNSSGKEENKPSNDSSRKIFDTADKLAQMFDNKPKVDQFQPYCYAFIRTSPLVILNNFSGSEIESEIGNRNNTPLE